MKKEYDFSKSVKNPYVKKLKKQISINLDAETIEYFKALADQSGAKYQTLINMFLSECVAKGLKINSPLKRALSLCPHFIGAAEV